MLDSNALELAGPVDQTRIIPETRQGRGAAALAEYFRNFKEISEKVDGIVVLEVVSP